MNLIDKDKVAAELEKKIKQYENAFANPSFASYEAMLIAKGKYRKLLDILSFINSLETKEVDLEKELEKLDRILYDLDGVAIAGATCYLTVEDVKDIAKRFFEMGINAQKGE